MVPLLVQLPYEVTLLSNDIAAGMYPQMVQLPYEVTLLSNGEPVGPTE